MASWWYRIQSQIYILSEINIVNENLIQATNQVSPWEELCYEMMGYVNNDLDKSTNDDDDDGEDSAKRIVSRNELIKVVPHSKKLKVYSLFILYLFFYLNCF